MHPQKHPPLTFNFGVGKKVLLSTHSACGKKPKTHQNQGLNNKKIDFSPSP
jgi:hypothetical protein